MHHFLPRACWFEQLIALMWLPGISLDEQLVVTGQILKSDGRRKLLDGALGGLLLLLGPNRSKGDTLLNLSSALVLSEERVIRCSVSVARTDEVRPG